MMSIERKKVSIEEAIKIDRTQREKYGATLDKILSEEAKKFNLSLDEFLENPECSKRVEQLAKVFEVMNQKEFREFNTVLAGAPGLGKHKS
jgi:DNA replication protein DnaC